MSILVFKNIDMNWKLELLGFKNTEQLDVIVGSTQEIAYNRVPQGRSDDFGCIASYNYEGFADGLDKLECIEDPLTELVFHGGKEAFPDFLVNDDFGGGIMPPLRMLLCWRACRVIMGRTAMQQSVKEYYEEEINKNIWTDFLDEAQPFVRSAQVVEG